MKQKRIFLQGEGDAWFERNRQFLEKDYKPDSDPVVKLIQKLHDENKFFSDGKILEVGCGDGSMLHWLEQQKLGRGFGVDPSGKAIKSALQKGLSAKIGTADHLNFEDSTFDLIVFGFCLYLCDREDLFRIASEANRVLKRSGWVIIKDFYSDVAHSNDYHHRENLKSFKMDYSQLFTWHPDYTTYSVELVDHASQKLTDEKNQWIAIHLIRKKDHTTE